MLQEGSVLTHSTASTCEVKETFSIDRSLNEIRVDGYSHQGPSQSDREKTLPVIEYGNEKREKTEANILRKISGIMAAAPNPYTCKQPSVDYIVSYTYTQASMQTDIQFAWPSLLPLTHAHTQIHTQYQQSTDPCCLVKAEGGLLMCNTVCHFSRQF